MPKNKNIAFLTRKAGFSTRLDCVPGLERTTAHISTQFRGRKLHAITSSSAVWLGFPPHLVKLMVALDNRVSGITIPDDAFLIHPPHAVVYLEAIHWVTEIEHALHVKPRNADKEAMENGELTTMLLDTSDRTPDIEAFIQKFHQKAGASILSHLEKDDTLLKILLDLRDNFRPHQADHQSRMPSSA